MQRQIARILFERWDPLGVNGLAPADEYEDYAQVIETMLTGGAGVTDVSEYLGRTRCEILFALADSAADEEVARAILATRLG